MDGVTLKPLDPEGVPLVLDSWAKSWRSSDYSGCIPNHLFFPTHKELIGGLIARGAKIVTAVCGERILAWICFETKGEGRDATTILHYCYTKDPFRQQGLGKELVAHAIGDRRGPVFYTHRTRFSSRIVPKYAKWAPEIARRREV